MTKQHKPPDAVIVKLLFQLEHFKKGCPPWESEAFSAELRVAFRSLR